MDRSNFPPRGEVRSSDLQYDVQARVFHTLRRYIDTAQAGIVTGIVVTAQTGGNEGLFNISTGTGYAPNGEYVDFTGVALQPIRTPTSDINTTDLIGVMYREVTEGGRGRLTDGVTQQARTVRSSELKVFTPTEYDALPETTTNLALDAKDRFLLCGLARHTDATLGTGGVLSITSPAEMPKTFISVEQFNIIPGLSVVSIDQDTPPSNLYGATTGVGLVQLEITAVDSVGTATEIVLRYRHEDAAAFSSDSVIFGAGAVSSPVTLTDGDVRSIVIEFDALAIPKFDGPIIYQETLTIFALYGDDSLKKAGAHDRQHRSQQGGHAPNLNNPHGLRLEDFFALLQKVQGTMQLGTGLDGTISGLTSPQRARQAEAPRLHFKPNIQTSLSDTTRTTLALVESNRGTGTPVSARVYQTGTDAIELVINATYDSRAGQYVRDVAGENASAIRFENGLMQILIQATGLGDTWVNWGLEAVEHDFVNLLSTFQGTLDLGRGRLGTGAVSRSTPRITTDYDDNSDRTAIWKSEIVAPSPQPSSKMTAYRAPRNLPGSRLSGGTLVVQDALEIVVNAEWDGVSWSAPGALDAMKVVIGAGGTGQCVFGIACKGGTGAAWSDSAWDTEILFVDDTLTVNNLNIATNVSAPSFTATGLTPDPPAANTMYAFNVPKAFGFVAVNAAGTEMSFSNDFNVDEGLSFIDNTGGTSRLHIAFRKEMSSSPYAVVATRAFEDVTKPTIDTNIRNIQTGFFEVTFVENGSGVAFPFLAEKLNAGGTVPGATALVPEDYRFSFVVFGPQA